MSKMCRRGATRHGVRTLTTAGLVAVVGAIVLGMLGMHGFSQHGVAPAPTDQSLAAVANNTDLHASHAGLSGKAIDASNGMASNASGPVIFSEHQDGSAGHMVTLCAAMLLAAAAGALLTLLLRRMARRIALTVSTLTPALKSLAATRLGTGPPAVWEFSVVRC